MEYLDSCRMREVGHTSTKLFHKQLSAQAFKVYSFVSLCERRVQNQHMVTVSALSLLSNSVALLWAPPSGLGVNCLYSLSGVIHRTERSVP